MSFSGGEFDGANVIALTAGYALSENLSLELNYSKVLGRFSSLDMTGISILHQPFPEWRVSPFFHTRNRLPEDQTGGDIGAAARS